MFKAAVLDIDTIVGVIVQANVQSAKLPFPIRGTKGQIAIHKQRFDARLAVFVVTGGAESSTLEVLGGLSALDNFLMPVECFDSRMTGDRVRGLIHSKIQRAQLVPDGLADRNKNRGLEVLGEVHGGADVGTKNREVLALVTANSMVHQSGKTVLHTNIGEVAFGFPGGFAPSFFCGRLRVSAWCQP